MNDRSFEIQEKITGPIIWSDKSKFFVQDYRDNYYEKIVKFIKVIKINFIIYLKI